MPKLTKRFIDSIKPSEVDVVHWDETLPSFGIRIRPSGRKVYIARAFSGYFGPYPVAAKKFSHS